MYFILITSLKGKYSIYEEFYTNFTEQNYQFLCFPLVYIYILHCERTFQNSLIYSTYLRRWKTSLNLILKVFVKHLRDIKILIILQY